MFITLLLAIGLPVAYLVVAGFVHHKVYTYLRGSNTFRTSDGDATAAFFAAALWPGFGPFAIGRRIATFQGIDLAERKRKKELAEADFLIEVAKRRLEEARILEQAEAANPLSIPR